MIKARIVLSLLLAGVTLISAFDEAFITGEAQEARITLLFSLLELSVMTVVLVRELRHARWEVAVLLEEGVEAASIEMAPVRQLMEWIHEITREMGVDASSLRVTISLRGTGFPCVVKSAGSTHLVIPVDFLTYCVESPGPARAVIAHEVAHVAQKDHDLFFLSDLFVRVTIWVQFPVVCLLGLLALRKADDVIGDLITIVPRPFLLLLFFYSVRKRRRDSEECADLAGAIWGGAENIKQAISALRRDVDRGFWALHPPPLERIYKLRRKLG
ncbi:M48 family metalloprotease [Melittangium boletus]|uniref:M48 family metalloprotease n=1 Tax=Melittangium boletus TaxID=83453 RepID=UPI003DA1C939